MHIHIYINITKLGQVHRPPAEERGDEPRKPENHYHK